MRTTFRKLVIAPLALALCLSGPGATWAAPLDIDIQTQIKLPGNTMVSGSGSVLFDTITDVSTGAPQGVFHGTLNMGQPHGGPTNWIWIPIVACLLLCFPTPAYGVASPYDASNHDIAGTMTSHLGAAGTATFTSHLSNGHEVLTADLSQLNLALLPALPPNFSASGNGSVAGSTPGHAAGFSTASLNGFSASNSFTYTLNGNPTALLEQRVIQSSASIIEAGPSGQSFSGSISAQAVPEPSAAWMFAVASLLVLGWRRRERRRQP